MTTVRPAPSWPRRPLALLSPAALAGLTACGEVPDTALRPAPDGAVDASFTCPSTTAGIQSMILVPRCGSAGCHGAVMPSYNLDLASPGLESRVVGTPSVGCTGERLVVAGDPARSHLYEKVATAMPTCGDRMPIAAPPLSDAQQTCISAWIRGLPPATPVDAAVDASADVARDAAADTAAAADATADAACGAGQTPCSGRCVTIASDPANCGGCGRACAAGQTCSAGACGVSCGPAVSFATQVQPIFTASCTTGCHGGARPSAGLSLAAGASYASLVGVRSGCPDGRLRVTRGSVSASYLVNKRTGIGMCSGNQMPVSGGPLPTAQIDLIRAWICNGAPNN